MSLFKRRETLLENLTFMGIASAINVVLMLVAALVPFMGFFLVLVLPLISAGVTFYCNKKYYPLYALATILLVVGTCFYNIGGLFYYLLPSLVTGFTFALLYEKGFPTVMLLVINTFLQYAISLASISVYDFISNRQFTEDLLVIFNLSSFTYKTIFMHLFVFITALIETALSSIVLYSEMDKIVRFSPLEKNEDLINSICSLCLLALSVLFSSIIKELAYPLLIASMLIGIYQHIQIFIKRTKIQSIILVTLLIMSVFVFAILYKNIVEPFGFLALGVIPFYVSIIALVNNYLAKHNNKDIIKK